MRLGNLALSFAASLSLLSGAIYSSNAQESFPLRLFKQAKAEDFAGSEACSECHAETAAAFPNSGHATFMEGKKLPVDKQGCEGCHGPGMIHVREENPEVIAYPKMSPKQVAQACLRCHASTMKLSHWYQTEHARANVSCVSCHQIHPSKPGPTVKNDIFAAVKTSSKLLKGSEPTLCSSCHQSEAAQFRMNSRHPIPEGRMICSDCHTPHPVSTKAKVDGMKEKCVTCHADIAGPFTFEHDPVAGWVGDGCGECHRAHGTQNPKLLKATSRGLCSQCHTDKATTHFPGRTCWTAGCHVAPHGSNTSSRFLSR